MSSSSLAVPLISSPTINVPKILSWFKVNSVTILEPIKNSVAFSTIAVAFDVMPVIVLLTKLRVFPIGLITLKILFVVNFPSDTLNICSLG